MNRFDSKTSNTLSHFVCTFSRYNAWYAKSQKGFETIAIYQEK